MEKVKLKYKTMMALQKIIENDNASESDIRKTIAELDAGRLRVAEKKDGIWTVNSWVKEAIIKYFGICKVKESKIGDFVFRDKIPLKNNFENVRIVPGGNGVRYGSFLDESVIMMPPSYVNIGAYVEGSDPEIDYAKEKIHEMNAFLQQTVDERVPFEDSLVQFKQLMSEN